jgi:dolichol-phosphate mannosyltransferase
VRTLVVLPTYDEAGNIREALQRVRAAVPDADVLVVDDSSPDGTAAVARAAGHELGQVDVAVQPTKTGLGNAYRYGFRLGLERDYDVLVQMDADLSWDACDLPVLIGRLDDGNDMVIGSRYVEGGAVPHWPWYRRALSRYGNRYACWVLGMPIHDATSGFRAYRADALKGIDVFSTRARGYGFQIETGYRMCTRTDAIVEVPVVFTDRVRGQSKLSLSIAVEELLLATWWGIRDRVVRRRGRR